MHKNKCLYSHSLSFRGSTGLYPCCHLLLFNHLIIIFQLAAFLMLESPHACRATAILIIGEGVMDVKRGFLITAAWDAQIFYSPFTGQW
ncbi:hypothetical protein DW886_10965 [Enterocloster aldenensis]|nr:hypothetical protein DW886_10965 [Enterocloster aldenensis]